MMKYIIFSFFIVSIPLLGRAGDDVVAEQSSLERSSENETENDYPFELINKITNDKEVLITAFNAAEIKRIQLKYQDKDQNEKIIQNFKQNLHDFLNTNSSGCEVNYVSHLIIDLNKQNIHLSETEIIDVFKMLRIKNVIDDVFFEILEGLTKDYFAFPEIKLNLRPNKNFFKNYDKISRDYDLPKLFDSFKNYPDEIEKCSYVEYFKMRASVGAYIDTKEKKNKILKDLTYVAYVKGIITLENFNRIKFLSSDSSIQKRSVWLNDYLKIVFQAKNKMIPLKKNYDVKDISLENSFSSEMIKRFSKITRRKLLYQKYDESQIIQLTQVMKKASQRMGVDLDTKTSTPYVIQEFSQMTQTGQKRNYVERIELDTQSQFNLARRLLRKDMLTLQMMKSFQKLTITYEDLVMASLETGYLTLDDIEYVVRYDDLWNPLTTKFERYMNMTFKIAGYGTFFLPPPWNVTAALGLSILEGVIDNKTEDGANNDNPNTFIE